MKNYIKGITPLRSFLLCSLKTVGVNKYTHVVVLRKECGIFFFFLLCS